MLSENHVVLHVNNVHCIVRIIFLKVLKDFELDSGLIVVLLLVFDDFESYLLLALVIKALDGDAERALAEELLDLVPISDVVPHNDLVVALVIIVAKVVLALQGPFDLLATLPDVEDLGVVKDLLHLESGKVLLEVLNSLRWV